MELAVNGFTVGIDELESVRPVAVHVPEPVGRATVTEQEGHLVRGLRAKRDEVPEHVRVLELANLQ